MKISDLPFFHNIQRFTYYEKMMHHFGEGLLNDVIIAVIMVILVIVALYSLLKILDLVGEKLNKTQNHWDDIIIKAIKGPLTIIIIAIGASEIITHLEILDSKLIQKFLIGIKEFIITISVSWFFLSYVTFYTKRLIHSKKVKGEQVDYGTIDGVNKLVKFLIFMATFIVILDVFGVNIKGIVAAAGIGGVALSFASKDLLANFFGTTIIYLDKPFTIGDWIKSPDKDIEGTVEEIGWRMTKIRRFDKRPIFVPNSLFSTMAIENPSKMTHRRIRTVIGIRYQDVKQLSKITDDIRKMLIDHPEVDTNQTLIVHFEEFADWSVNFLVYTFTYTTDWVKFYEIRQDVMIKISDIIESNDANIAFPTSTLELSGTIDSKLLNK